LLSPALEIVELLKVPAAEPLMNEHVLVSQRSGPQDLEQSTVYRWNDFATAFAQMATEGIADNTFEAPTVKAGLVNIALFLAQCMHETIQYNACDENNWSIALGVPDYPSQPHVVKLAKIMHNTSARLPNPSWNAPSTTA
jgi:hypothetical protein